MTSLEYDDPWEDRLSEHVDGLLTESETRALDLHLQDCERCREVLAQLREVVQRLRADRADQLPERVRQGLTGRLAKLGTGEPGGRGGRSWRAARAGRLRLFATAASLMLALAGGVWAGLFLGTVAPAWMTRGTTDSGGDAAATLRRSLAALDQELAASRRALEHQPADQALQRVVARLVAERRQLDALLDSLTAPLP